MAIADKYATADSAMQKPIGLDAAGKMVSDEPARKDQAGNQPGRNPQGSQGDRGYPNNRKRGGQMSDERYESRLVAVAEVDQPTEESGRRFPRPKPEGRSWVKSKY